MSERVEGVGRRVRTVRKLAGLTQEQLAHRAHVSVSLVSQVEQGRVPASPSFVATAARALRVSVPELYRDATPRHGDERGDVAELETVVMAGAAADVVDEPSPLDTLAVRLDEVAELQRRGRYGTSSGLLLALLDEVRGATRDGGPGAFEVLGRTYLLASLCLHRLGSPIAAQAGERAISAAERGSDPLLAAVATDELGMRLLHRGAYGAADRLAARARDLVADLPDAPAVWSVRGHTHLSGSIIAARAGDPDTSSDHLREAAGCAAHVPDGRDDYDTAFGPSNVTMHAVAAAVEMGDGTTALSRDAPVSAMPSRVAHHHVDLARACLLHGDRERTLAELNAAREAAPQLTRYHPMTAETVRVLAEQDRRRTDSLAAFARWAGVAV